MEHFVQTLVDARVARLPLLSLSQADPRASSILVDEFNSGPFEYRLNRGQRNLVANVLPGFNICDRVSMEASRFCQIAHRPI